MGSHSRSKDAAPRVYNNHGDYFDGNSSLAMKASILGTLAHESYVFDEWDSRYYMEYASSYTVPPYEVPLDFVPPRHLVYNLYHTTVPSISNIFHTIFRYVNRYSMIIDDRYGYNQFVVSVDQFNRIRYEVSQWNLFDSYRTKPLISYEDAAEYSHDNYLFMEPWPKELPRFTKDSSHNRNGHLRFYRGKKTENG